MAKKALVVTIRITGLQETLAKLKGLPDEANKQLRKAAGVIAADVAKTAKASGMAEGAQAALEATTVTVKKDRFPAVQAGGGRRLGRYGKPAYKLLFGSEFGMNEHSGWYGKPRYDESTGFQYQEHRGQSGAWFFPSVEENAPEIADAWTAAANAIVDSFGEGV
jgi:hypothetical protein